MRRPRGAGARLRIRAFEPAHIELAAELRYRKKGEKRSISMGDRSLTVDPAKRFRLQLPARLQSQRSRIRRAGVVLKLRARPVDPADCELQAPSRVRLPLPLKRIRAS